MLRRDRHDHALVAREGRGALVGQLEDEMGGSFLVDFRRGEVEAVGVFGPDKCVCSAGIAFALLWK